MSYRVYLKKKEDKRIRAGHPWVYANEVERIEGSGKNGDLVSVYDFSGNFIGKGFINHVSKILVRLFIFDDGEATKELFAERIKKADEYRKKLGYDNCYRMVFAEADELPALIIDKYDDVFSIQILSLGMELHKQDIVDALVSLFSPRGIYERSDVEVRKKEGLPLLKGKLYGDFDTRVIISENGLKMVADLENGQKTGYFLDQKENRFAIRRYCKDADVLDCFCNVGGFSLNAAAAGAKSVTALDISDKALRDVEYNAELNGFEKTIVTQKEDVFEALRRYKRENKKFDVLILDPPAFCKNANEVRDAYRGYKDINILGMKLVRSGGFLVTASCSHYMTIPLFEKMLSEAARDSGRRVRIAEMKIQSPDHPSLISEAESMYLKFFVLHVE
ncbi:MAG: class I SAM-dependent rRNA methyltransferase [Clostridiales bacterium]|nr:class I SAM-dependent rRNA methyltransferase [Clostridiales bacterium]